MPDLDEYKDFDVNAAAAEIGSDLFGAGEGEGVSNPPAGEESTPPAEGTALETAPAPGEESPAPPSPEPEVEPLPKTWKKEMEAEWKTLPASVRAHVIKRENDVYAGFQQYASGHKSYSAIVEPFKEIFSQHPDVQPVQLFQNLMHSHVKLLTLPPEEKAAFGRQLLEAYGISPEGAQQAAQALPPGYATMQQELAETRRILRQNQEAAYQAEVKRYEAEIKAFAEQNPLFPEVQNDILHLISTGAAQDVKTAYETAVWANPSTRAKLLAQQQEAAEGAKPRVKKPMTNIESSGAVKVNSKPASIDATVDSVIAKHFSTH